MEVMELFEKNSGQNYLKKLNEVSESIKEISWVNVK